MLNLDNIFSIEKYKTEQSEEGLFELTHQHGKKIHSKKELKEILIELKNKHGDALVSSRKEFEKLGGFMGTGFIQMIKMIGPSGTSLWEENGVYLMANKTHGTYTWRNVFAFKKNGKKFNKKDCTKTMKVINVACILPKEK